MSYNYPLNVSSSTIGGISAPVDLFLEPTGKISCQRGISFSSVDTNSTTINLNDTMNMVFIYGLAAPCTVNFPNLPDVGEGFFFTIKDADGGAATHNITLNGNGNTIDGNPTYVMSNPYESVTLCANNSAWSIV